ncbi:type II toxin-antitoxin system PemK/MazF family toxin [Cellulomonas xiejunii]|uniref:type II toxin-antitoxin system PemK/MazF family toxin n=1 Tax=Cellulomonas xiejunii TaxID=2968083 RepID=UPI001D0EA3D9|nr:type II toxin-antitoxin system PemK/MazF family toxin [Cellulomonas xiejunii]MCC2313390.1 type II toxin-antitoxin system PemK/MazF family toxin [Cellulomonas xiejunii]
MTERRWRTALRGAARRLLPTSRPGATTTDGLSRRERAASTVTGGELRPTYAPRADGRPDPGEVVWTWVPYEDDPARGKDRPVLVVAVEGGTVVGLMLTSKDHDRDAADEARRGRLWLDVGAGAWDRQGRPSEVRLDRLLRLPAVEVRREGAALDPDRYAAVVRAAGHVHGW